MCMCICIHVCIVFHLHKILENTNSSIVPESRSGSEEGIINGQTLGGDGYVHYLDFSDELIHVYTCHNLSNCTVYSRTSHL